MITERSFQACLIAIVVIGTTTIACSQEFPSSNTPGFRPDPNLASIEGRVLLPSGRSANINIRVTLSNTQSPLATLYSNKNGEFRFSNLTEGVYYIQVAGDPKLYDPATEKVRLTRGRELHLTISLKGNDEIDMKTSAGNMVSASEFDQKVPASAKKEYEKALRLINSGKPQLAIEHLNRAIAIYPDYHKARNDLGVQLLKLKRLEEAAEQFHAAIERSPKYFNPRLNLGLVLIEWKKYSEAMEEFSQAISIDSSRPAAHLWLGIALLETSDMASAERELLKALLLGGSAYSVAHYYMAHIHMRRGDNGEAVRELKAYLVESPAGEQAPHARLLLQRLAPGK